MKEWKILTILNVLLILSCAVGCIMWLPFGAIPIEESGIAYYTMDGPVYNLYLYPYGIFLDKVARILIFMFVMIPFGSFAYITCILANAEAQGELTWTQKDKTLAITIFILLMILLALLPLFNTGLLRW